MKKYLGHLVYVLLVVVFFAGIARAADEPKKIVVEQITSENVPDALSASAVMDEIEAFNQRKDELSGIIVNLGYQDVVATDFEDLEKRLAQDALDFKRKRGLSSWDFRMAGDFSAKVKPVFADAEKIKADYLVFLKSVEDVISDLETKRNYFQTYLDKIKTDPSLEGQLPAIKEVLTSIRDFITKTKRARTDYTKTYQAHSEALAQAYELENELLQEVDRFKGSHLHKTVPAFFEKVFFTGFGTHLADEIHVALRNMLNVDWEWVNDNRNKSWPFVFSVLGMFLFFRRLKARESWGLVLRQPLGLALTITLILAGLLVSRPIPVAAVSYWVVLSLLIIIMMRGYSLTRRQRRDIDVLVVSYALLQIVDTLGLPLPLYRLLLVLVALALSAYCFHRLQDVKTGLSKSSPLEIIFRLLICVFAAAIVTEAFGYHLLAAFFIRGAIKSSFLVFVIWNLQFFHVYVIARLIERLFDRLRFSHRDREVIHRKIRFVFHALLFAFVVVALTTIWGFYDSIPGAIAGILNWGTVFRGHEFTVGMMVNAAALLYVVLASAEIACSVLEEEFYPRKHIVPGTGKSINSLITYFSWVVGLTLAFAALGFQLRQFAIIAGALSVGIGFGLQNIVNNFVSGLILLFERPIKVGDILDIDGEWGIVEKMGLRSTVIRSGAKTQIIIPNSDFVTQRVENLTFTDQEYRITVRVNVGYGGDTEKVKRILLETASRHHNINKDPQPEVYFMEFGENAMIFDLWAWTYDVNFKRRIISDLLFEIDRRFRAEGVEVPYPQRVLHLQSVDQKILEKLK